MTYGLQINVEKTNHCPECGQRRTTKEWRTLTSSHLEPVVFATKRAVEEYIETYQLIGMCTNRDFRIKENI